MRVQKLPSFPQFCRPCWILSIELLWRWGVLFRSFFQFKDKRDLITGLKTRTNTGRPNWDEVFNGIKSQGHENVKIFYCGNPSVCGQISNKCNEFGFEFTKEIFWIKNDCIQKSNKIYINTKSLAFFSGVHINSVWKTRYKVLVRNFILWVLDFNLLKGITIVVVSIF